MPKIKKSLPFHELELHPDVAAAIALSDDIQQTLALLSAWAGSTRRLIRCADTGVLYTVNPRVLGIEHVTADEDNYAYQGGDKVITELIVRGYPSNSGNVWVKNDEAASTANAWPLASNEWIQLTLNNLKHLHLLIETNGQKAILLYR